jgi:hypothetical protein
VIFRGPGAIWRVKTVWLKPPVLPGQNEKKATYKKENLNIKFVLKKGPFEEFNLSWSQFNCIFKE